MPNTAVSRDFTKGRFGVHPRFVYVRDASGQPRVRPLLDNKGRYVMSPIVGNKGEILNRPMYDRYQAAANALQASRGGPLSAAQKEQLVRDYHRWLTRDGDTQLDPEHGVISRAYKDPLVARARKSVPRDDVVRNLEAGQKATAWTDIGADALQLASSFRKGGIGKRLGTALGTVSMAAGESLPIFDDLIRANRVANRSRWDQDLRDDLTEDYWKDTRENTLVLPRAVAGKVRSWVPGRVGEGLGHAAGTLVSAIPGNSLVDAGVSTYNAYKAGAGALNTGVGMAATGLGGAAMGSMYRRGFGALKQGLRPLFRQGLRQGLKQGARSTIPLPFSAQAIVNAIRYPISTGLEMASDRHRHLNEAAWRTRNMGRMADVGNALSGGTSTWGEYLDSPGSEDPRGNRARLKRWAENRYSRNAPKSKVMADYINSHSI